MILKSDYYNNKEFDGSLLQEVEKTSHRRYTTGFYFGAKDKEFLETSMPIQTHEFMAIVKKDACNGYVTIEQRNRFKIGDELEVLSPGDTFNQKIIVEEMMDENGNVVTDASLVQQILLLKTNLNLREGDILRKLI